MKARGFIVSCAVFTTAIAIFLWFKACTQKPCFLSDPYCRQLAAKNNPMVAKCIDLTEGKSVHQFKCCMASLHLGAEDMGGIDNAMGRLVNWPDCDPESYLKRTEK